MGRAVGGKGRGDGGIRAGRRWWDYVLISNRKTEVI